MEECINKMVNNQKEHNNEYPEDSTVKSWPSVAATGPKLNTWNHNPTLTNTSYLPLRTHTMALFHQLNNPQNHKGLCFPHSFSTPFKSMTSKLFQRNLRNAAGKLLCLSLQVSSYFRSASTFRNEQTLNFCNWNGYNFLEQQIKKSLSSLANNGWRTCQSCLMLGIKLQ